MVTGIYLLIAWALMFSYQIFTQTALTTVVSSLGSSVPLFAGWLSSKIDLAIFVCSFAWMFILSSIVSALIFAGEKRVFIQFLVSLALAVVSSVLFDVLRGVGLDLSNPNNVLSGVYTQVFGNVLFSIFYLSLPYIFMLIIDLHAVKKVKRLKNAIQKK